MYNEQYRNPVAVLTSKKANIPIKKLPAKFGRNDSTVDVYFFHESISREHCLFECINKAFTVRDLGSTVGTYINGIRLDPNVPYKVEDGAKLTLGKVTFVVHCNYDELAAREQAPSVKSPQVKQQGSGYPSGAAQMRNNIPDIKTDPDGKKTFTISAKELNEFEYDENEVQYVDCGLRAETAPLSYTSKLRKQDIEVGMLSAKTQGDREEIFEENNRAIDEIRQTQMIEIDQIEPEEAVRSVEIIAPEIPEKEIQVEEMPEEEQAIDTSTQPEESAEEPKKVLVLSWIDDESGDNKKIKIDRYPFRIGRKSDENDYAVRKKGISRRHLCIEEQDGAFYVTDDNSTNGVKVNGKKIKAGEKNLIKEGDNICIADVVFTVAVE